MIPTFACAVAKSAAVAELHSGSQFILLDSAQRHGLTSAPMLAELLYLSELNADLRWTSGATRTRALCAGSCTLEDHATHYLMQYAGHTHIAHGQLEVSLQPGMYMAVPGAAHLHSAGADARTLIVSHAGYRGLFQLGGPIEAAGRLRYIDGCTDSLVLAPPVFGDPCVNHLHIPPNTVQTAHTHPSLRVGIIMRGSGICVAGTEHYELRPGLAFSLAPEFRHSFWTKGSALDVLVYHPDSDTGPTDANHPMRNRTIL